jgi:hypothetical protein
MAAKKEEFGGLEMWHYALAIAIALATFLGGMALNAFTIAEKIATKPYVEDRLLDAKKYTDDKGAQILKDAFEHSDKNRADMLYKMETISGELKTNNAILSTKLDSLTKAVQDIRDWSYAKRKGGQ